MTLPLAGALTPDAIALIEEQQAMLTAILNSSHDAIICETNNGVITTWNSAAEKIFGYTAEFLQYILSID